MLADLPAPSLDKLCRHAEVETYRKRSKVWVPGEESDRVCWVRSGVGRIVQVDEEGRELTMHFFSKHHLFGEGAAMGEGTRDTLAVAHEDLTLYTVSSDVLREVMTERPKLALDVAAIVAARRRALQNRMRVLLFKPAAARLASVLQELSEDFGVRDSRGVIINLRLTHRDMASLIGSTRETVSYIIMDMRREKLVLNDRKRVILLDVDGMAALAAGA